MMSRRARRGHPDRIDRQTNDWKILGPRTEIFTEWSAVKKGNQSAGIFTGGDKGIGAPIFPLESHGDYSIVNTLQIQGIADVRPFIGSLTWRCSLDCVVDKSDQRFHINIFSKRWIMLNLIKACDKGRCG